MSCHLTTIFIDTAANPISLATDVVVGVSGVSGRLFDPRGEIATARITEF